LVLKSSTKLQVAEHPVALLNSLRSTAVWWHSQSGLSTTCGYRMLSSPIRINISPPTDLGRNTVYLV